MKNTITFFFCLFVSGLSLSAQSGFKLIDIVSVPYEANWVSRTPQFFATSDGGFCTFEVTYNSSATCKEQFKLEWSFSSNVDWLDEHEVVNVNLKAAAGEEPCGYKWVHGNAGGSNNLVTKLPGYGDWEYNGNISTSGLNNVNGGRVAFAPGGISTASQEISGINKKDVPYTGFYILADDHYVWYIYRYYEQKPAGSSSCESGNCGSLYNMSINAGATHIRLGANHSKTSVISNLDNTITSAKSSGCFDTQYLEGLRDRIASEGRSTSSYRAEFESWMHGIPAQIAQDCPCCLPCGSSEGTATATCPTPSTANFEVRRRSESELYLASNTDGIAWRWEYTTNGLTQTYTDDDPYFNRVNLPSGASLSYRLQVQCSNGEWSDWSSTFYTSTLAPTASCTKPNIDDWKVLRHTSDAIRIDANIEAVEYQWTWYINGKLYESTDDDPIMGYINMAPNSEVVIYLTVKCANGQWSEESDRFVIYTKGSSSSRSRSIKPKEVFDPSEEKEGGVSESVDQGHHIDLAVYPNPASDFIKLEGHFIEVDVLIRSVQGKVVARYESVTNGELLDITNLAPGPYTIQLRSLGEQHVKKLVVSR
ncbi:MAG: T9SS type A sorting domain-containing protein [Saprospiraceae bacterium]|nr:T9SS type A sorting domain-containing protein [Saprospiraceae bacterium]